MPSISTRKASSTQLAHYTLQDGKVFDMITRTTPTGGKEMTFLGQLLSGNGIGKSMARSIFADGSQTSSDRQAARNQRRNPRKSLSAGFLRLSAPCQLTRGA